MFEAVEVGAKLSKKAFAQREQALRVELLEAQRAAKEAGLPVIVVIGGVEGAGKGAVVNQLRAWCDPRGLLIHAIWDETDEERQRPRWWRFWRRLPPRGWIGVLFGSWYTRPIVDRAFERIDAAAFDRELVAIEAFERMLDLDGALIVKLWFHIRHATQVERYEQDERTHPGRWMLGPSDPAFLKRYKRFRETSERAIRATDTGHAPWHLIEAEDEQHRDIAAGEALLGAIRDRLARPAPTPVAHAPPGPPARTVLDAVDLGQQLDKDAYEEKLERHQLRLHRLAWGAYKAGRSAVCVFEGWDAAGKGGAIKRLVDPIDARLVQVVPIAAPTDEERAQHYLWRFWRQIPRDGRITVFDRSWYGRVLVERVEGFCSPEAWARSYHEITAFERQLVEHGVVVCKFWLHISPEEQARRFEERASLPHKQHKLTDEDWRNREKWAPYAAAVHDLVERTSTLEAPWTLVPANDKRFARVKVLRTLCDALERAGVPEVR